MGRLGIQLRVTRACLFGGLALLVVSRLSAQQTESGAGERLFNALKWRSIGPGKVGGRVSDIAIPLAGSAGILRTGSVMYVASSTGGLFKTTTGGASWTPVFDREATTAIHTAAVAPSDPNVVWVGTGDATLTNQVQTPGRGVYRSTDAGTTWTNVGLERTEFVGRIAVHPTNASIALAGAIGPLTRPSRDRGLYRTTDGGRTWAQVLFVNDRTGVIDVIFDPVDPNIAYAATWQRAQSSLANVTYGPGSGLYKSTDGGASWRKLTRGLPAGMLGRCGLAISRASPRRLYALVHDVGVSDRKNRTVALYRSNDAGENWEHRSDVAGAQSLPAYWGRIAADPANADRIYVGHTSVLRSEDGGMTFTPTTLEYLIGRNPSDIHSIWIDPAAPSHMVVGGDQGVSYTLDGGTTFIHFDNIPLTQVWRISADRRGPFYYVYGAVMDNKSWGAPARTRHRDGVINEDWINLRGGEAGDVLADPIDTTSIYLDRPTRRYDPRRDQTRELGTPGPVGEPAFRNSINSPLLVSPHDPKVVYAVIRRVYRSRDRGDTWRAISPELGDRYVDSTALMDLREATVHAQGITALAESPVARGVLYAGGWDGSVYVTRNNGVRWTRIDPPVAKHPVTAIVPSRSAAGTAYVVRNATVNGDYRPHLFRTTDYGAHWQTIGNGLPADAAIWALVEHPRTASLLFVGTNLGVFVSTDSAAHWRSLRNDMPAVPVRALTIQPDANDLIAATHGRGIWVLDDISALEHWDLRRQQPLATVFPVRATPLYPQREARYPSLFTASNPPYGVLITYALERTLRTEDDPRLEIVDDAGRTIRLLPVDSAAGVHRSVWDMREGGGTSQLVASGSPLLFARPGVYRTRLSVITRASDRGIATRSVIAEQSLTIIRDPLSLEFTSPEFRQYSARARSFRLELADVLSRADTMRAQLHRVGALSGEQTNALTRLVTDSVDLELQRIVSTLRGSPAGADIGTRLLSLSGAAIPVSDPVQLPSSEWRQALTKAERGLAVARRRLSELAARVGQLRGSIR